MRRGRLFCFGTGSDAAAEHEMGSAPLMAALCGSPANEREHLAAQLKRGTLQLMPQLRELRRIKHRLDKIVFVEQGEGDAKEAALGFHASSPIEPFSGYLANELRMSPSDQGAVGAWDSGGFVIKVSGEQRASLLRGFAEQMRNGSCFFAGSLLDGMPGLPPGVIIADRDLLTRDDSKLMERAQEKFEGGLRLLVGSRLAELEALVRAHVPNGGVGHLWPVWKGGQPDTEVLYALNPGYGIKAGYYGPYAFDALKQWIMGGASAKLG